MRAPPSLQLSIPERLSRANGRTPLPLATSPFNMENAPATAGGTLSSFECAAPASRVVTSGTSETGPESPPAGKADLAGLRRSSLPATNPALRRCHSMPAGQTRQPFVPQGSCPPSTLNDSGANLHRRAHSRAQKQTSGPWRSWCGWQPWLRSTPKHCPAFSCQGGRIESKSLIRDEGRHLTRHITVGTRGMR